MNVDYDISKFLHGKKFKVLVGQKGINKNKLIQEIIKTMVMKSSVNVNYLDLNFNKEDFSHLKTANQVIKYIENYFRFKDKFYYIFLCGLEHFNETNNLIIQLSKAESVKVFVPLDNLIFINKIVESYDVINCFPLSFSMFKDKYYGSSLELYLTMGGLEFIQSTQLIGSNMNSLIRNGFYASLYEMVKELNNVRDLESLELVIKYLLFSTGKAINALSISDYYNTIGKKISVDTIIVYLNILSDNYFFYKIQRFDLIKRVPLKTQSRYYIYDHSLIETLLLNEMTEKIQIIENIIAIELLRRGFELYNGKSGESEIKFIAFKNKRLYLFELIETKDNYNEYIKKINALARVKDAEIKYLISFDKGLFVDKNIVHINIEDFLQIDTL